MIIIGITGGVGSGKSEVLAFLEKNYDAAVVRADEIGRDLMRPGTECTREIIALFGPACADADGRLDRGWIANEIFRDPAKRDALEGIIHPRARREISRLIDQNRACGWTWFFVEAALLIEQNYREICDELWYIHADLPVRLARLAEGRGYSEEKSRAVMESQLSEEDFRAGCDVTIDNSGAFSETIRQIEAQMQRMDF